MTRTTPPHGRKFALIETEDSIGFAVAQWEPHFAVWFTNAGREYPPGTPWHPLPYRAELSRVTHEMGDPNQ